MTPAPVVPADLDASLVLVRHGESRYIVEGRFQGQADTQLSELGIRQAGLVAARLARPHDPPSLPLPAGIPTEIVHSPLARAADTARAIATAMATAGHEAAIRPDPGLTEIGQGAWEGLHRSDIEARDGERLAAWRQRPAEVWAPDGESLADVQARLRPALAGLLGRLREAGGSATAPTAMTDAVAGYDRSAGRRDRPWSVVVGHDGVFKVALLTLFDLPLERFWMWSFELAAISVVDVRAGRVLVRALNLDEHLAPLLDDRARTATEGREQAGAL